MTHKGDGAGLGLDVVRSVLDFLGGSVRVDSEPGTCGG
jgi:chemotaxis protein histidine kinase CheA